jgi:hypothetical protein
MKYWEIIIENLRNAGWNCGSMATTDWYPTPETRDACFGLVLNGEAEHSRFCSVCVTVPQLHAPDSDPFRALLAGGKIQTEHRSFRAGSYSEVIADNLSNAGCKAYNKKLKTKAIRSFVLAFDVACEECGFRDCVKLSNIGWQGGTHSDTLESTARVV